VRHLVPGQPGRVRLGRAGGLPGHTAGRVRRGPGPSACVLAGRGTFRRPAARRAPGQGVPGGGADRGAILSRRPAGGPGGPGARAATACGPGAAPCGPFRSGRGSPRPGRPGRGGFRPRRPSPVGPAPVRSGLARSGPASPRPAGSRLVVPALSWPGSGRARRGSWCPGPGWPGSWCPRSGPGGTGCGRPDPRRPRSA
jgi:hypothetical protein